MAQTDKMEERPKLGRPPKYDFFLTMKVGSKTMVTTKGLSEQERWRLLRSLRSIASHKKTHDGRIFRAGFCSGGIQVERRA